MSRFFFFLRNKNSFLSLSKINRYDYSSNILIFWKWNPINWKVKFALKKQSHLNQPQIMMNLAQF